MSARVAPAMSSGEWLGRRYDAKLETYSDMETVPRPRPSVETLWRPALFYRFDGNAIQCTVCPHECRLRDGDTGLCRVRRRTDDHMETATYAAAVVHVDAIERKPLYHFAPGARVVTIAPPGCSLSCDYCQNYRLSQVGRIPSLTWTGGSVDPLSLVALADEHDSMLGFSYSEPSLAIELTLKIAAITARPLVWKTNGFMTAELMSAVAPRLAAANIDLKAPDETRCRKLTGGALTPVVESLRRFIEEGVWVEVSTPLIPKFNCDEASVRKMAEIILGAGGADVPWHLLRFVPDFRLTNSRPTHPDELAAAVSWARAAGLRHVYVERALGAEARNTYCRACGSEVVSREIWRLAVNRLERGACPDCGAHVPGRW